ncbi:hypothetical protein L6164_011661 [Bauhinia variegata]|uniref:Uncharacterized protein n=1 Tax=Bauhinia variegata TaxID=167791 RepID=A0ACB9P8U0_BAUVA|nr:hypothetical protein L6164_011661 [Bauhinia variegata]
MGTKIEYSINVLSTSAESNNLTVGGVDVWEHYKNKGLSDNLDRIGINKLEDPMDRMLDRNNIESIKKTMQMHENIFKHQVQELHRVYSVQKMMMDELKKDIRQKKLWSPMNGLSVSHPNVIDQQQGTRKTSYGPVQSLRDDPCSREKSGSCSTDTIKVTRGFDLERPAEEDILTGMRRFDEGEAGPSSHMVFQSCKMSNDHSIEEIEVDLTLSIGGGSQEKKRQSNVPQLACSDSPNRKSREFNLSASYKSDRLEGSSDPTTPISSSSVTVDQERKRPRWLPQSLKLK